MRRTRGPDSCRRRADLVDRAGVNVEEPAAVSGAGVEDV